MSLTLRWACIAPKSKGKLDTYIWQPFRKPPPFAYVKIFVSNREDPRNLRMRLLFYKRDSLTSFQQSYAPMYMPPSADGVNWSPASEGLSAIVVVYRLALRETFEFLRQASRQIMALVRQLNLTLMEGSDTDFLPSSADFRMQRWPVETKDAVSDPSERLFQKSPAWYAAKLGAVARSCWIDATIHIWGNQIWQKS